MERIAEIGFGDRPNRWDRTPSQQSEEGAAHRDLLNTIVANLSSDNIDDRRDAASDLEILVSSSAPKEEVLLCGEWEWTAEGACENRSVLGGSKDLWPSLVKIITEELDTELVATVLAGMSKLGFRHTYNVINIMRFPGMHEGIVSLLGNENVVVRRAAWRVLHNFCSGIDDVKTQICSMDNLDRIFAEACSDGDQEVRRRAVSVIMHCSSSDQAKQFLVNANVFEAALQPILSSQDEELATVIRATLATANVLGKEERSYLTTAPELLRQVVDVTSHGLDESTYCGIKWSLKGVMLPLFNLSVSDANKKGLITFGIVEVLLKVVEFGELTDDTQELALRTLANLTFDPDAMKQMVSMDALEILGAVVTQANGESGQAKEVAQDLVYLITGGQDLDFAASPSASPERSMRPKSHVMISYSWLEKKRNVVMLTSMLRKRGLDVWRDEEGSSLVKRISGSSMDIMAEAIEVAEFVVIFVSRAYRDSYNCKLEGKYAQIRERAGLASIIYVMMEQDYTPQSENGVDGWLGIMIGDSIWYKGWDASYLQEAAEGIELAASRGQCDCFLNRAGSRGSEVDAFERTESRGSTGSHNTFSRVPSGKSGGRGAQSLSRLSSGVYDEKMVGYENGSRSQVMTPRMADAISISRLSSSEASSPRASLISGNHMPAMKMGPGGQGGPMSPTRGSGADSALMRSAEGCDLTRTSSSASVKIDEWSRFAQSSMNSRRGSAVSVSEGTRPVYRRASSDQNIFSKANVRRTSIASSIVSNFEEQNSPVFSPIAGGSLPGPGMRLSRDDPSESLVSPQHGPNTRRLSIPTLNSTISSSEPQPKQLSTEMMKWVTQHKLEGMIDIFIYHCIDDPEIASLLTEDMVKGFTDKIGLHIRLMAAIEEEKMKQKILDSPVPSEDRLCRTSSNSTCRSGEFSRQVSQSLSDPDVRSPSGHSSTSMIDPGQKNRTQLTPSARSPVVIADYTNGLHTPTVAQFSEYHY
jgi:hypothetical protein